MIEYSCPKCKGGMSYDESLAGDPQTCPECGNVAIVPVPQSPTMGMPGPMVRGGIQSPTAPAAHQDAAQGPVETSKGLEPEKVLLKTQAAHLRGNAVLLFIVCPVISAIVLPVGLPAMMLTWGLFWCFGSLPYSLIVTNRRTIYRGYGKDIFNVRHADLCNIHVKQGPVDRIMRVGALELYRTQGEPPLIATNIPDPQSVVDLIRRHQG